MKFSQMNVYRDIFSIVHDQHLVESSFSYSTFKYVIGAVK